MNQTRADTALNSSGRQVELRVLCIWDTAPRLREYLQAGLSGEPQVMLDFPQSLDAAELCEQASAADVIIGWRPTEGLLDAASQLKLWIHPGVGVRHLLEPLRALNAQRASQLRPPVTLVNGHGNTYFTAQHAVALLLALMNKVVPHHNWLAAGEWGRGDDDAKSIPLRSQRIGLLGYGAIGSRVHKFLSGFDLSFSALRMNWDKQAVPPPTELQRFVPAQLDAFLAQSDILFVALPHTSRTEKLLGGRELALLPPGALLVNIARGSIIDEDALFDALSGGRLAGAALDVWYNYRPEGDAEGRRFPFTRPFHELGNVVLSPHRAASPFDDLPRWDEVIENLKRLSHNEPLLNVVSLEDEY